MRYCYICKQQLEDVWFCPSALTRQNGRDPCRLCASKKRKEKRLANLDRYRQQDKERYKKYRHTWAKYWNWKQYGLSSTDIDKILDRQQGKCLGCNNDLPLTRERGKTFVVDHNHKTGEVRGLLCNLCNRTLGFVKEDKQRLYQLAAYLELDRTKPVLYLIGSLRNPEIPHIGNQIRDLGFEVIDNWWAAGKIADDSWQEYSNIRGRSYKEALKSREAQHIYNFDKAYLNLADTAVLVLPAGKSAALEFGYVIGSGKRGYILQENSVDRYDIMFQFSPTLISQTRDKLFTKLTQDWLTHEDHQPTAYAGV